MTQDLLENPDMTWVYLFPDSPRGYDIIDDGVIKDVCAVGMGTVRIRAKLTYHPEGHYILCNGFPERTTMDSIIKAIGEREHRSPLGIKDISDKSDLENTEFWIILRKGVDPEHVIHELYSDNRIGLCTYAQILLNYADRTKMMSSESLPLKDAILKWIDWRIDIKHRTIAKKLRRLREEKHRLEALVRLKTQNNLDGVFEIIKTSDTDDEIIQRLMDRFGFTSYQADLISNMRLKNQKKSSIAEYLKQYSEIDNKIAETEKILMSRDAIKQIIWDELEEGKKLFGKPRSCRIIKPESTKAPVFHYRLVVTKRYIKRLPFNGVGAGFIEPDDDTIQYFPDILSSDYIHIGTEDGYWCYVPIDSIASCDASSKGVPLTELIGSDVGNVVTVVKTSIPSIKEHPEKYRLYCFTSKGLIKATPLSDFTVVRKKAGAITLNEGDKVCFMGVFSDNDNERLVYTKEGLGIILKLANCPSTGRLTKGQRVMKLGTTDEVLGVSVSKGVKEVLVVTKKGFAKIVELDDAFIATKKRQTMLTLTRFTDGDELFKIQPITKDFYHSKLVFYMQSGEKNEIETSSIKVASRNSKCFKVAPVRKGDSIIRLKLI